MSSPFIGMISVFGFNFAPVGWAFCDGQLLPISQYTALFSLLGITYGGNGTTTFALPDLRGRAPNHMGQGPGLSNYSIGQIGGTENVTLNLSQMPAHTHVISVNVQATAMAKNAAGNSRSPAGNVPATEAAGVTATYSTATPDSSMSAGAINASGSATAANSGSGLPFANLDPYLTMNYCIALTGIFPARS